MTAKAENLIRFTCTLTMIALGNNWIITFGHNDDGTGVLVVYSDTDDHRAYVEITHDAIDRDPYSAAQAALDTLTEAKPRDPLTIN